jgi:hypothetical protein
MLGALANVLRAFAWTLPLLGQQGDKHVDFEIDYIGIDPATNVASVWLIRNGDRLLRKMTWFEASNRWGLDRPFDRYSFEQAIRSNIRDFVR